MTTFERIAADAPQRLDILVAQKLGVTRSFARKLILDARVRAAESEETEAHGSEFPKEKSSGKKPKPSLRVTVGDVFVVDVPPPESLEIEPEEVPFNVVYEDDHLLVVNKPAGIVVHPAPGHWKGTLVHGLLWRYPDMGPFNNVRRPGIVHRLDATTSGLMLVAREQKTMELLQQGFRERAIKKEYLALATGTFAQPAGVLEGPVARHPQNRLKMAVVENGRPSTTEYRVLWTRPGRALVVCRPLTGRTHQIRVHMAAAGHPLVGDFLYGWKETRGIPCPQTPSGDARVFLHSWRLAFTHPITKKPLSFLCSLPPELVSCLSICR